MVGNYALRKQIDGLKFGQYHIQNPFVDFGNLDAHPGINVLLGSDILVPGRFVMDLGTFGDLPERITNDGAPKWIFLTFTISLS